jgi:hypothetical protein
MVDFGIHELYIPAGGHWSVLQFPFSLFSGQSDSSEDPFYGISASTFPEEVTKILMGSLDPQDIEIKPDGK